MRSIMRANATTAVRPGFINLCQTPNSEAGSKVLSKGKVCLAEKNLVYR